MALFTHIILDTFTAYGTQLFMPFSDFRAGFDSINIVDPVYTIPLLLGLLVTVFSYKKGRNNARYNRLGLMFSTAYLLATLVVKQHIIKQFERDLEQENIEYLDLLTVPVQFGNINWYGVAKTYEGLHIGKYSLLKPGDIQFEYFPINDHLLEGLDPWLVNRMKWFAKDFYVVVKNGNKTRLYNMQCDMQGIRDFGEYKAPTAFYFEIIPNHDGSYELAVGMHRKDD
jgi:inner membrane protein